MDSKFLYPFAHFYPSTHSGEAFQKQVSLIVIHCISLPPNQMGTNHVHDFFLGKLNLSAHPSFSSLKDIKVSAHLFIRRNGEVLQYVPFSHIAWHAGVSSWKNQSNCNDYSIGIELEGSETLPFEEKQYHSLAKAIQFIHQLYPLTQDNQNIVGHSDIAPGRKTDPGMYFNWFYLDELLTIKNNQKVSY